MLDTGLLVRTLRQVDVSGITVPFTRLNFGGSERRSSYVVAVDPLAFILAMAF